MERVNGVEDGNVVEVFENDIQVYLSMFCEEQNIEDMRKESQSVWNACMRYICRHVFKPNPGILKSRENITVDGNTIRSNFNAYNYELVDNILDYYIYLCQLYNKEISVVGFTGLTGIDDELIYEWGKNNKKLSSLSFSIYQKLFKMREESLSNKLFDGKQNPVGVLGILNRHYQWNLPGVSREQSGKQALGASELPRLGRSEIVQIEQKQE